MQATQYWCSISWLALEKQTVDQATIQVYDRTLSWAVILAYLNRSVGIPFCCPCHQRVRLLYRCKCLFIKQLSGLPFTCIFHILFCISSFGCGLRSLKGGIRIETVMIIGYALREGFFLFQNLNKFNNYCLYMNSFINWGYLACYYR